MIFESSNGILNELTSINTFYRVLLMNLKVTAAVSL